MMLQKHLLVVAICVSIGCFAAATPAGLEPTREPLSIVAYPEDRPIIETLRQAREAHRLMGLGDAADLDINSHGDECIAAIGPIPPFSCLDGATIPITVNGVEPAAGQYTRGMSCDRPVQLGLSDDGQCVPYARIGQLPSFNAAGIADRDVSWIYICRRYKIRQDPAYPNFEDVAIVGHKKSTGATCFFQTLSEGKGLPDGIRATRVPPPSERSDATPAGEVQAREFWFSPRDTASIKCYTCHDSDPWVHTPYIDQVKGRAGDVNKPIVPDAPTIDDPLRYTFVGSQHFTDWPPPTHFKPKDNRCVTCHRIGPFASSGVFTDYAIGLRTDNTSNAFKQYPRSHWMPPGQASAMEEVEWNDAYKSSADQIRSCRQDSSQAACKLRLTNP